MLLPRALIMFAPSCACSTPRPKATHLIIALPIVSNQTSVDLIRKRSHRTSVDFVLRLTKSEDDNSEYVQMGYL